jgi:hypothetical protein
MAKIGRPLAAAVWALRLAELRATTWALGALETMIAGMPPGEGAVAGETMVAMSTARRRYPFASYVAYASEQRDRCSLQDKDGHTRRAQQDGAYWLGIGIVAPRNAWCLPAG